MTNLAPDITDISNPQRPKVFDSTLPSRTIKAIVERGDAESMPGVPHGRAAKCTITVKNHATEGVLSGANVASESAFDTLNMSLAQVFLDTLGAETIIYYPYGAALDEGKDGFKLAIRPGGTPKMCHIGRIVSIDKAMITLEVY